MTNAEDAVAVPAVIPQQRQRRVSLVVDGIVSGTGDRQYVPPQPELPPPPPAPSVVTDITVLQSLNELFRVRVTYLRRICENALWC